MQLSEYFLYLMVTFDDRLPLINMINMNFLSLIFCLLIILTNCPAQKKQGTANSKKQETQNQPQVGITTR